MGDTDKAPFLFDVVETAQEELAKAPGVFDLAEDRLGELLAETIATSVTAKFELSAHRLSERPAELATGRWSLCPPCGDVC